MSGWLTVSQGRCQVCRQAVHFAQWDASPLLYGDGHPHPWEDGRLLGGGLGGRRRPIGIVIGYTTSAHDKAKYNI